LKHMLGSTELKPLFARQETLLVRQRHLVAAGDVGAEIVQMRHQGDYRVTHINNLPSGLLSTSRPLMRRASVSPLRIAFLR